MRSASTFLRLLPAGLMCFAACSHHPENLREPDAEAQTGPDATAASDAAARGDAGRSPDLEPVECDVTASFVWRRETLPTEVASTQVAPALAAFDLDGDLSAELAVGHLDGRIEIWKRAASWTRLGEVDMGMPVGALAWTDLDGDAGPDLAAVHSEHAELRVARHMGGAAFAAASVRPLSQGPARVVPLSRGAGERPSLLLIAPRDALTGASGPSWIATLADAEPPRLLEGVTLAHSTGIAVVDVDQDGDDDVTTAFQWLENQGQGGLVQHERKLSDDLSDVLALNASDLNGDGELDLALVSVYSVEVHYGNGSQFVRAFESFVTYGTDLAVGRFTCDAVADIVSLAGDGLRLHPGAEDGFSNAEGEVFQMGEVDAVGGLLPADFDGDGRLDLVQPRRPDCADPGDCGIELSIFLAGP